MSKSNNILKKITLVTAVLSLAAGVISYEVSDPVKDFIDNEVIGEISPFFGKTVKKVDNIVFHEDTQTLTFKHAMEGKFSYDVSIVNKSNAQTVKYTVKEQTTLQVVFPFDTKVGDEFEVRITASDLKVTDALSRSAVAKATFALKSHNPSQYIPLSEQVNAYMNKIYSNYASGTFELYKIASIQIKENNIEILFQSKLKESDNLWSGYVTQRIDNFVASEPYTQDSIVQIFQHLNQSYPNFTFYSAHEAYYPTIPYLQGMIEKDLFSEYTSNGYSIEVLHVKNNSLIAARDQTALAMNYDAIIKATHPTNPTIYLRDVTSFVADIPRSQLVSGLNNKEFVEKYLPQFNLGRYTPERVTRTTTILDAASSKIFEELSKSYQAEYHKTSNQLSQNTSTQTHSYVAVINGEKILINAKKESGLQK